ncbi:hypothetical protein M0R45_035754 [Rubus argutus]|uniref:Uncharacterized protein n=1 Tax=Rubus argutus TaxID=59490 RepID=A0AAW1VYI6_RUBAR
MTASRQRKRLGDDVGEGNGLAALSLWRSGEEGLEHGLEATPSVVTAWSLIARLLMVELWSVIEGDELARTVKEGTVVKC